VNAPLIIFVLGSGLAFAAYLIRTRRGPAFGLAAGGSALLGAVALGVVLGQPFQVLGIGVKVEPTWTTLGRSMALSEGSRITVGFVLFAGAALLLGGWAGGAPRRLAPLGILILLAVAAALMVEPFVFAPTLLAGAAILGSLAFLRGDRPGGRAAPRLLIAYVLAMMAILTAGWFIETGGVSVSVGGSARTATVLLGLGLAIVAIVPPFHTWLTAAADEAHPIVAVFLALILQSAGLFLLMDSLGAYPWMRSDPLILSVLRGAGFLIIIVGGLWVLTERRGARLIAYALMVDFGVSLLAMSTGVVTGYTIALGMAGARVLGGVVAASGLGSMKTHRAAATGVPLAAAASALVGGLSLAGFPLTAGFPGRWMTLAVLGRTDSAGSIAVVFAVVAVSLSVVRWWRGLDTMNSGQAGGLSRAERAALWGGSLLVIAFGLAPGWLYGWAAAAVRAFGGLAFPPAP
jgi:formate hydrogenlyase subunit 3/multisubunit Na+/H+ antiporter MnhD subunit